MGNKRKKYSSEFKAKVALVALKNEETTAEIAQRFGVHPTMISAWKRSCLTGQPIFSTRATAPENRSMPKSMNCIGKSVN